MNLLQKSEAKKFWRDVYLLALSHMIAISEAEVDGKPITTVKERSDVAKWFADEAVNNITNRGL